MAAITCEADLSEAFHGRRILITGHTGFKGGWLALWLRRLGASVVGLSLPPSKPSFFLATELGEIVEGHSGDIRVAADVAQAIQGQDFDLVIHMAAQAVVRTSFESPVDTYATNVVGTAIVLDAARRLKSLKGVIVVTSDKCYENREWVWGYRENDPMGGRDPYSSSKGCAELVAAAYRSSFFNDASGPQLVSVRAGNVIGGGDWGADRLVPDLVRSVESGNPARLRNPSSIRPWQHVFEPLRGYMMLAAHLVHGRTRFAGGWNFGPDQEATVNVGTLAQMVVSHWGDAPPRYIVEQQANGPVESTILRLDSTKARTELGWKPVLRLDDAVAMTAAWYRKYRDDPTHIRSFSEHQLEQYADAWKQEAEPDARPSPLRAIGDWKDAS
ncbi:MULTISPECIES: CDP-glucose 4,6-dehydratase [unclassified Ensifer]|uniref:CDP-glucose 4,6-dehydratase n=1 Tax=unclassified Ensifer TaxID=2633371 RepID=UPI000813390A|nr:MULTISPECIES: CDP-glucose 4,6-dehydratase [unclassified Ensifer]OCP10108.1 CDP-glucose 4,6-dehydratase [Ensifer sp. LC14]OCP12230.1 CDP-glucose 4,6-dehydratase [Ensifer sp. LC13]OCP13046.1 CDP-glucose 4,6-dehydratase [Ensifer sp. LC11]OCP33791.1 CDP-glucose 4,6-dehydratase [Ensifer sp. LC499]